MADLEILSVTPWEDLSETGKEALIAVAAARYMEDHLAWGIPSDLAERVVHYSNAWIAEQATQKDL